MNSAEPTRNPLPTTDIIIEMAPPSVDGESSEPTIVLVRRKNPPHGWALPGGFIDAGESAAAAARREAKEETGLDVTLIETLGVYSDPKRDPRGIFTLSVVFIGRATGEPRAGDDAAEARAFSLSQLPPDIVFDHPVMLDDYRRFRTGKGRPPVDR